MSARDWGILNFLTPDWRQRPDCASDFVVDDYRDGPSDLEVESELLVLSGRVELALWIRELMETADGRDVAVLDDDETDKLIDVLATIMDVISATLVDEQGCVPLSMIDDLKARSFALDFNDAMGHRSEDGVEEALVRVAGVRAALISARTRGLEVALN